LQLLPPTHFTLAPLAELPEEPCANTGVVRNIAPTAAAKTAPVTVLRSIVVILLSGFCEGRHGNAPDQVHASKYTYPAGRRFEFGRPNPDKLHAQFS
jgi:hypothetical protein